MSYSSARLVAVDDCPLRWWASSGLMELTGRRDGPPTWPAADLAGPLHALLGRLTAATSAIGQTVEVDLAAMFTRRAAILGLTRGGDTSAGGSARLLPVADGWVALNLARAADFESLPAFSALLGRSAPAIDPAGSPDSSWELVSAAVRGVEARRVIEAGDLLGLALGEVPAKVPAGEAAGFTAGAAERKAPGATAGAAEREAPGATAGVEEGRWQPAFGAVQPWVERTLSGGPGTARPMPIVIDLSSLWAGPLCAQLLGLAGCRVVKVESTARPDGARHGDAEVWRWLHDGHQSLTLDFASESGRAELTHLIETADVIIEASRGRALDQLGLGPQQVATRPGAVWVSITGYGRSAGRVAFGDDAAVAGGLVAWDDIGPMFCGDAMGDPLAGLTAAVGASEALANGGGVHLDVSMAGAMSAAVRSFSVSGHGHGQAARSGHGHSVWPRPEGGWELSCRGVRVPVLAPVRPPAA